MLDGGECYGGDAGQRGQEPGSEAGVGRGLQLYVEWSLQSSV